MTAIKGRRRLRRRHIAGRAGVYVVALVAVVVTAFPFIWLAILATKTPAEALHLPPDLSYVPRFDAFAEVWNDSGFADAFLNSVIIMVLGITFAQIVGVPAAFKLTKLRSASDRLIQGWLLIVYILPPFLFAIPMFVLYQETGLFDTEIGLAIMYQVLVLPFTVWLLASFLRAIPESLGEAAAIDGASRLQTLLRVYLPLLGPGMATTAIITGILIWNELTISLALSFSSARPISLAVAGFRGYASANWDLIAAASLIALLPTVILAAIAQRLIVRGLTAGAVK